MVLGNFKIIKNEYINVLHVHQKKGNAKWVKDPARRNSRQVIIFVCLLKVFSSYALLYMYLFMLGNRGKQKYDVRDIVVITYYDSNVEVRLEIPGSLHQ